MENRNNLKRLYFLRAGFTFFSIIFFLFTDVYKIGFKGLTGISLVSYSIDYILNNSFVFSAYLAFAFLFIGFMCSFYKRDYFFSVGSMLLFLIFLTVAKSAILSDYSGILDPSVGFYMYIVCAFITLVLTLFIEKNGIVKGNNFYAMKVTASGKKNTGWLMLEGDKLVFEGMFIWNDYVDVAPLCDIAKVIKTPTRVVMYAKGTPYEFCIKKENDTFVAALEEQRRDAGAANENFRELIKEGV